MTSIKSIIRFSLFCLFLCSPAFVMAQSGNTGALTGSVIDPNGAVVPDVQIIVTNEVTHESKTVVSQLNGNYTVPLLLPSTYRVEFSKSGFKSTVNTGLRINVTETARLDVRLEVGGAQETVVVNSSGELLQTESSALGRVTDDRAVANLPLVNRNYTQIVTLSPGIAAEVPNATELGRGSGGESGGAFRSHGAFGRDNNFQMNGVEINDLQASGFFSGGVAIPNPDAITEFKVQTGQYDASYGRNAGAVVDIVTKSGANDFHGNLFEFFRNDVLNANEFFRNAAGQDRGVLKQNQFGFTLGGPIKKNKLLFFASYQGTRQINGVAGSSTSNFFTPPFTNDRSRAALGSLFAGQSGLLGGVAVLPNGSNISPQAFALLNLKLPNGQYIIPTPQTVDLNQPFDIQGFSALSVPATFNEDQYILDLDYLHTSNSKFTGRFFYANSKQNQSLPGTNPLGGAPAPGFPYLIKNRFRNFSLAHTYTFSSNLFNQAQFGYHRIRVPAIQVEPFNYSDIGVNAPPDANTDPTIAIAGSLTLGGNGQPLDTAQSHYNLLDSMTYLHGRHTLHFGGGMSRSALNLNGFHFPGGLFFLSWPDFLLGLPAGPAGNDTPFSNIFLSLNVPGLFDRHWKITDADAFIQDDIKVTPALTLNLGLRYEKLGNLADELGRNSGFNINLADPNPPAGGTLAGFTVSSNFPGTVPAGVTQLNNKFGTLGKHQNTLVPRLGFAWKLPHTPIPFSDRMVLRGGYGIYYSRSTGQPFIQLITGIPFATINIFQGTDNGEASFANPFRPSPSLPQFSPYSPTTQLANEYVNPNYRPPMTQEYSLNLQTDLGHNLLLEVGYVGTKGKHQIIEVFPNQARLASPANPIRGETTNTVDNISNRVPILGFTTTGLHDIASVADSRYNGLEVSLTKRLSKGLQFLAAYTFSHAYSTAGANTNAGGSGIAGDQSNPQANYGRANFNRAHRLVVSYVYELPRIKKFNGFANQLFSGWMVAGTTTIQSGPPLSLIGTNFNNAYGISFDRAQLAPGCTHDNLVNHGSIASNLNNYFNTTCIARDASGAPTWPVIGSDGVATGFGNSGVGIVVGPGQKNSDLAIIKRTSLGWLREGANLEFRTEFFNVFNSTQFAPPDTDVTSSTFGVIAGTTVNPRIIQFGLKLNF